jgi:hypothetical protein
MFQMPVLLLSAGKIMKPALFGSVAGADCYLKDKD